MANALIPIESLAHVNNHPLVKHKMSELRSNKTDPKRFRELVREIGALLGYEATKDLRLNELPGCSGVMAEYTGHEIAQKIALVPILRAGIGLVDAFLDLLPYSSVFHLGLFRDKVTLQPVEYYNKLPPNHPYEVCLILDPMLGTGGTAIASINMLKEWGCKEIKLVSVCACEYGVRAVKEAHPDVEIYAGAVDAELSDRGYIIPGLGDAGDRLFNTIQPH